MDFLLEDTCLLCRLIRIYQAESRIGIVSTVSQFPVGGRLSENAAYSLNQSTRIMLEDLPFFWFHGRQNKSCGSSHNWYR